MIKLAFWIAPFLCFYLPLATADTFCFTDGTRQDIDLSGNIELHYSFGKLYLPIENINKIIFTKNFSFVETLSGLSYVARLDNEQFSSRELESIVMERSHFQKPPESYFHVQMKEGTSLSLIGEEPLKILQEGKQREIAPDQIQTLVFNGGISGMLLNNEMLPFSFAATSNFVGRVPDTRQLLSIPWELVDRMERETGLEQIVIIDKGPAGILAVELLPSQAPAASEPEIQKKSIARISANIPGLVSFQENREIAMAETGGLRQENGQHESSPPKKIHVPNAVKMIRVKPDCMISAQMISNLQYKEFVDAIDYKAPSHWVGGAIPIGLEQDPVENISYRDAYLYAVWAGKRLATFEELQKAAEKKALLDLDPRFKEWTATRSSPGTKQLFSHAEDQMISLKSDDSGKKIGFRVAND